jgi:hypothetical protein
MGSLTRGRVAYFVSKIYISGTVREEAVNEEAP